MKKILLGIMTIGIAGLLLGLGTYSYLSDVEKSSDNYFTAGEIDLKVDCDSYYWRDFPEPHLMDEIHFDLTDLTVEKFFAWDDLKPGDHGEATISFHVYNNDAWGWLHFFNVSDDDNGLTEPESDVDTTGGDDEGELSQYIYTFMWLDEGKIPGWQGKKIDPDEGDNEFDTWECDGECHEPVIYGVPYTEEATMYDMHEYDCCWTGPWFINGSDTVYIGWYWWIPTSVGNIIQSDSFEFGAEFYVEQHRNNPNPEPPGTPCGGDMKADLEIEKTADEVKPVIGSDINFTIKVTNNGPDEATGVKVEDILHDNLSFVSADTKHGSYDDSTGIWDVGDLADQEQAELVIRATVEAAGGSSSEFTQLAMVLDGSGSINESEWEIMLEGLADAVENNSCFPHDGSVELTVVQFGGPSVAGFARVEIQPTVVTDSNYQDIADDIRNLDESKIDGFTPMACGILCAGDTLNDSSNFSPEYRQVINLVTDGVPNRCCYNDGDWNQDPCNGGSGKSTAEAARDYLIDLLQMTEDQDEFDVEAVGDATDAEWLKDEIVWPEPGSYAPPFNAGWVRNISSYQEFAETICEKFQVIFLSIENCAEITALDQIDENSGNDKDCVTIYPQPEV